MSWFTKVVAFLSRCQKLHGCVRGTARLGVEALDERELPSAPPIAPLGDDGTHPAPIGHVKAMAEEPQILFPVFAQTASTSSTIGGAHEDILFPVFAQARS